MLISGLSFIRNGISLGYPFIEAIRSILPLVDEMVVVVGHSEDGTREAVAAIGDNKIRIIDSVWPSRITPKACVLAQQTNLGLMQCRGEWVVYVQGNEVFHERDLPRLRELMTEHVDNPEVEGLVIERLVFYGDYQHFIRTYPDRHKYVVRVFKPWNGVHSITDGMSFAVFENWGTRGRRLRCIDSGMDMFRYGKLLSPEAMRYKLRNAPHKLRGGEAQFAAETYYAWQPHANVRPYRGTHPAVMQARIAAHSIQIDLADPRWRRQLTSKERRRLIESAIYRRFGVPRWRPGRYTLVGRFVPKDREPEA